MKPTREQLEDQLLDALLHEQGRADRGQALEQIENALDAAPVMASPAVRSPWPRRLGIIAASVALGGFSIKGIEVLREKQQAAEKAAQASAAAEAVKAREQERVALAKAIVDQEDKVEERRKVLATIARTKGLVLNNDGVATEGSHDKVALEAYHRLEQEKMQLESQIGSLLKYDNDQLMVYAVGIDLPNNVIRQAWPKYQESKRELEGLKVRGLGDSHPSVIAKVDEIEQLKKQLDEGVVSLRSELKAKLDVRADQLRNVAVMKNETREEAIRRGLDAQDYTDAISDYDADVRALAEMKLRQAGVGAPVSSPRNEMAAAELPQVEKIRRAPIAPRPAKSEALLSNLAPGSASGGMGGVGFGRGAGTGAGLAPERRQPNTERYGELVDPSWQRPDKNPLSTFSIDVDNASYSNIRRMIRDGQRIPADAVRIEECVNAFDYAYQKPSGNDAFAVHTALATCPWNEQHLLVKVGIKGREIAPGQRPASNLVFLIDVSGSMQDSRKLPLVKESLKLLLHQLDERDSVSFVVYAGGQGVVLPITKMTESGRVAALDALGKLEAGGSTNGGAGIQRAYEMAREGFVEGGVNRVILATDGDFNVGVTNQQQLVDLVKERAAGHVYLSVLGFGTGNLNDSMLEAISKDGNGNHYYIDSIREGRKVLLQKLSGTLVTIAKDVKIQIEFNPAKVGSYRLIGYANRVLKDEDFNNDKVDAGDIGAGHTVTAFYEIVPAGAAQPNAGGIDPLKYQKQPAAERPADSGDEWLTLKLRHKHPEGDVSALQESVVKGAPARWQETGADFQFASAVAMFGMKLRGMDEVADISWNRIREIARPGLGNDVHEDRAEFVELLEVLEKRGN